MNYFSVGYAPEVDTAKSREKDKQMMSLYLASIGMMIELKFIKFSQFPEKCTMRTGHTVFIHTYLHEYIKHMCGVSVYVFHSRNKEQLQYYGADRNTISTEIFKATGSLLHSRPNANLFCTELAICNSHTSNDKSDNLLTEST